MTWVGPKSKYHTHFFSDLFYIEFHACTKYWSESTLHSHINSVKNQKFAISAFAELRFDEVKMGTWSNWWSFCDWGSNKVGNPSMQSSHP